MTIKQITIILNSTLYTNGVQIDDFGTNHEFCVNIL